MLGLLSMDQAIERGDGIGQQMPSPDGFAVGEVFQALERYKEAAQFRRRANEALRGLSLSFAHWRVLESAVRLVQRTGDACCHADVARDLALGEPCLTRTMRLLSTRGLVSHDIDNSGINYRVYPTDDGSTLIARAHSVVVAAARKERAKNGGNR